ncbi:MAG: phosphodiester glycosidase family protein [Syntrophomonadaceae bacterium]|jgi:exopolysaccharide biosynthesis protein|nr:phosphodiester glycosidase family protein [Syntrophomonadaceae bacterium]
MYKTRSFGKLRTESVWAGGGSFGLTTNGALNLWRKEQYAHFAQRHPRTAIGQRKDLIMLFVVVDGRSSTNRGVTGRQLANIMLELKAWDSLNADGGGSSTLWLGGKVLNKPSDGKERSVGSVLLVY